VVELRFSDSEVKAQCQRPASADLGAVRERCLRLRLQQLSAVDSIEEVSKLPCLVVSDGSHARVSVDQGAVLLVTVGDAAGRTERGAKVLVVEALLITAGRDD